VQILAVWSEWKSEPMSDSLHLWTFSSLPIGILFWSQHQLINQPCYCHILLQWLYVIIWEIIPYKTKRVTSWFNLYNGHIWDIWLKGNSIGEYSTNTGITEILKLTWKFQYTISIYLSIYITHTHTQTHTNTHTHI